MPRGKRNASPELRPVEPPPNDLNDEQKAALFIGGIERLERLIADKDEIVADIRNARKVMKSEGFSREEVDFAIWSRKEGEEASKESFAMRLRISEWLGRPLGYQPSLDLGLAAQ
jgi:uncharacterized protein (UPF0335 family)